MAMEATQPYRRNRLLDEAEIRHAAAIMLDPDQVFEVRALEAALDHNGQYTATYGGYFNNVESMLSQIRKIKAAKGIYITLQTCKPNLIHRIYNELVKQKQGMSTADSDITGYRWLLIDSDPDRDPTNISATNEEHDEALRHSQRIAEELQKRGWPTPIFADSGNGGHLLYRIDLPQEDKGLVERTLKGLGVLFDLPSVHVDQTVFNPSRICKLYGTLVCKGANTPLRSHRMSKILSVPSEITVVRRDLLENIALPEQTSMSVSHSYEGTKESFSAEDFIQKHHIGTYPPQAYAGGTRWLLTACVWNPDHNDHSACIYQFADGRLGANCSHNSCKGRGWKDFRLAFEPDAYTRNLTLVPPSKKKNATPPNDKAEETKENQGKEPSAQARLMEIAKQCKFINSPSGALFARVPINGHHEVIAINEKGSGFRRWLTYQFHNRYGYAPNSDALSQSMSVVQAIAEYEGEKAQIHTRLASHNGCIYLDLANDAWECIEISKDGWRKISCPPVYFRRPSGMLPLPIPETGGNLNDLRQLINVKTDKDYVLLTSWLVGAMHPTGPYPVLNLNGERGSTKSKTTTFLRNLIDPNEAPGRNAPKDERDAAITAQNNRIIALDNLSSMPGWLSDILCRISTGAGFTARELYSDDSERVFHSKRPIILNGIEDGLITQGDLLNRTMLVTLEPPTIYRKESELDALFQEAHPRLLGALLTVTSQALRDQDSVHVAHPPRMADFAAWMTAAEPVLKWLPGTFMSAYAENQDNSSSIIVESSPVAKAIMQFMSNHEKWEGLTKDLLIELQKYEIFLKAKTAPTTPNKLSGQLKRVAPSLRIQGIDIQQPPRQKDGSHVILQHMPDDLSDVDKTQFGVDKLPSGVDKTPAGVDKISSIYTTSEPVLEPFDTKSSLSGVDGVDKIPLLSGLYPPHKDRIEEIKEEEKGVPDRAGILSTPSTPTVKEVSETEESEVIPVSISDKATWGDVATEIAEKHLGDIVYKEGLTYGQTLDKIQTILSRDNVYAVSLAWARAELEAMGTSGDKEIPK